jgi:pimeloyl-ACP methyl ester carboxylesterase
VRSPEPDALPLILTHGWPSSPVEFQQVIGPLTDPAAHGADPADAFHVVIPSLPWYGFSTPVTEPGWGNLFRVAQAWSGLMSRLDYERYAVHGTDVGSGVADLLAMIAADPVVGTHLSGTVAAMPFGPPLQTEGLAAKDRERAERFNKFRSDGIGYLHMQATRPATIGYSLNDSPSGNSPGSSTKYAHGPTPPSPSPRTPWTVTSY